MSFIYKLSEPQNHRCCYCGHEMIRHQHVPGKGTPRNAMTKDHFDPRVYGGPTTLENMIAACFQCNNLRGEMEAIAFFNLQQKWFRKDPNLRESWHQISFEELWLLKIKCLQVHERQLKGMAYRHKEHAFRHISFVTREYNRLQRA